MECQREPSAVDSKQYNIPGNYSNMWENQKYTCLDSNLLFKQSNPRTRSLTVVLRTAILQQYRAASVRYEGRFAVLRTTVKEQVQVLGLRLYDTNQHTIYNSIKCVHNVD